MEKAGSRNHVDAVLGRESCGEGMESSGSHVEWGGSHVV